MPVPRKILIRVIGAPLLVAALCALLYWGHGFEKRGDRNYPLYGLIFVVGFISALEIAGMCRAKGIEVSSKIGTYFGMAVVAWFLSAGKYHPFVLFGLVTTLFFLHLCCVLVFRYGQFTPEAAGLSLFGYLYVCLLGFLLFPPVLRSSSSFYLLFLLAAGKGSDMAAFVVGKAIGRHKMTPVVSPNKTWEGGIAGGIVGTAAGFAVLWGTPLRETYGAIPVAALLLFCLLVTIAGQVGDLVKSAFKRWAGVKDSGRILPEFGGMIDMVDSFILEAPVACIGTLFLMEQFKGN